MFKQWDLWKVELLHIIPLEFNVDKKNKSMFRVADMTFLCIVVFMAFPS
jgi:hypothetical protein